MTLCICVYAVSCWDMTREMMADHQLRCIQKMVFLLFTIKKCGIKRITYLHSHEQTGWEVWIKILRIKLFWINLVVCLVLWLDYRLSSLNVESSSLATGNNTSKYGLRVGSWIFWSSIKFAKIFNLQFPTPQEAE